MELDRRQWYVRWFFWSLGIWDEFRDRGDLWRVESQGTNLCHFIRVTIVWAPLVLLLHLAVYGSAIAALTLVPVVFFGFAAYISLILAIAATVLTIWGVKRYRAQRQIQRRERAARASVASSEVGGEPVVAAPAAPRPPGFFETLWIYIVAAKQKVCPTIQFREPHGRTV